MAREHRYGNESQWISLRLMARPRQSMAVRQPPPDRRSELPTFRVPVLWVRYYCANATKCSVLDTDFGRRVLSLQFQGVPTGL
jgi:hypothetical protein